MLNLLKFITKRTDRKLPRYFKKILKIKLFSLKAAIQGYHSVTYENLKWTDEEINIIANHFKRLGYKVINKNDNLQIIWFEE